MYAFCLFSFSFTSVKRICMCLSTRSLFLIPFLVCVVSVTLFWLTSYLFCFQVGSIYKLSVLNLSSSLGAGRILWSDVALPAQFPAALLLDSLSFVLGQLFTFSCLLLLDALRETVSFALLL